jgi:coenzyme F420-reducing hydrogenase delta subunit
LAEGVVITGCPPGNCHYRLGNHWTDQRLARERDPRLRARIPSERLAVVWAGGADTGHLSAEIDRFVERLAALPSRAPNADVEGRGAADSAPAPLASAGAADD